MLHALLSRLIRYHLSPFRSLNLGTRRVKPLFLSFYRVSGVSVPIFFPLVAYIPALRSQTTRQRYRTYVRSRFGHARPIVLGTTNSGTYTSQHTAHQVNCQLQERTRMKKTEKHKNSTSRRQGIMQDDALFPPFPLKVAFLHPTKPLQP